MHSDFSGRASVEVCFGMMAIAAEVANLHVPDGWFRLSDSETKPDALTLCAMIVDLCSAVLCVYHALWWAYCFQCELRGLNLRRARPRRPDSGHSRHRGSWLL